MGPVDIHAAADVGIGAAIREARQLVLMRAIHRIWVEVEALERSEIGGVSVVVEEDDVVGIDCADSRDGPVVEWLQPRMGLVARLVENIVAGDGGIALEVLGEVFPQPDRPVLKLLLRPEMRQMELLSLCQCWFCEPRTACRSRMA